jgi:hypothetical protein
LLATKHRRFKRPKEQEQVIRDVLKAELQAKLSGRSERRYRGATSSEPHVNALIHLTVAHAARYTDALRAGGSLRSDKGRFSLEALLKATHLEDLLVQPHSANPPGEIIHVIDHISIELRMSPSIATKMECSPSDYNEHRSQKDVSNSGCTNGQSKWDLVGEALERSGHSADALSTVSVALPYFDPKSAKRPDIALGFTVQTVNDGGGRNHRDCIAWDSPQDQDRCFAEFDSEEFGSMQKR